ncbi:MAG TPA: hypothetical protein VNL77_25230 [Roseiflexaceae bacterium]|nr:hypothetical protein [Roseiflexaceae bacterium]
MLSIFLTLCGLYAVASGKAPIPLIGRKGDGAGMRLVGLVLALTFPLSLMLRVALPMSFGETMLMFAPAVEIGVSLLTLAAAFIVSRRARQAAGA